MFSKCKLIEMDNHIQSENVCLCSYLYYRAAKARQLLLGAKNICECSTRTFYTIVRVGILQGKKEILGCPLKKECNSWEKPKEPPFSSNFCA